MSLPASFQNLSSATGRLATGSKKPCGYPWDPFSPRLIHPHVIDFEARRKRRLRRITALGPADCKVEDQILWLVERIRRGAILVDGSRQEHFIQPFAVHRQDDGAFVPVHSPDMKP